MKTIKIHLKIVAFLISSMIMLQGCTVYKSTTVTLDEAYKAQTKTKVFTLDNETLKFKRINFVDGKYYGVLSWDSERHPKLDDMLIDENKINSIKVKNKTASTIINVGVPIVVLGGIIWIGVESASYNMSWDWETE